jgi:hypothetical protein
MDLHPITSWFKNWNQKKKNIGGANPIDKNTQGLLIQKVHNLKDLYHQTPGKYVKF